LPARDPDPRLSELMFDTCVLGVDPGVARLGPDPMDAAFTAEVLAGILAAHGRQQLKGVLRDQSVIAGIGNAYSDEILHAARLLPFRKRASLADEEVDALYAATRHTLAEAITVLRERVPPTFERQVRDFLAARIAACERAGIARERLVADPGFGFGKTVEHNLTLLKRLPELCLPGVPLLAGWSRKSSLGRLTGRDTGGRMAGSLAAALLALLGGAKILRVHDVKETRDLVMVWDAWSRA